MIIDGRALAQEILAGVKTQIEGLGVMPVVRAITVSPKSATQSYLRAKMRAAETAGMQFEVVELAGDATTEEVIEAVKALGADAVVVQLPLPAHIDEDQVLASIPLTADADALSPPARAAGVPVPPVAAAVEEILTYAGVSPNGLRVVVIGKGRLVGEPVAARLAALGANVESYDEHTFTPEVLATADIVVAGTGMPHLVKPEMVKEGVILIDAGTSESNGAIVGDIDPTCAAKASVYTPVPGGVGPLTVACLIRNVAQLRTGQIEVL